MANKTGDTLAELSSLKFKQNEEQKTILVKHSNKEKYKEFFSKDKSTRPIEATENFTHALDEIHNEMLKHPLPPEGLDSLLALYIKI